MIERNNFDIFIIDEADACILEKGYLFDIISQRVIGFWDLLQKRTILLSATIQEDLQDVLKGLFGLYKSNFLEFDELINEDGQATCT